MSWTSLFRDEPGLLGPGGQLTGRPSQEGKLRPGRLSTAVALAKKKPPKPPDTGAAVQKPGLGVRPGAAVQKIREIIAGAAVQKPGLGVRTPPGGAVRTSASPIPGGGGARSDARPRPGVPQRPRQQPPGQARRIGRDTLAGLGMLAEVGLGDVINGIPFNANGRVWVSAINLPLLGLDPRAGSAIVSTGYGGNQTVLVPFNWPDGSPCEGRFWFPALDMSATFDPTIAGTYLQGTDPRVLDEAGVKDVREMGRGGWRQTAAASNYYGTRAWEYVNDYFCSDGAKRARDVTPGYMPWPPNNGQPPFDVYWVDAVKACKDITNVWQGLDKEFRHWGAVFDWHRYPPSVAAPIWFWLNLGIDPAGIPFVSMEAEIYRADLQKIDIAGEPSELPGLGWLCLDVLDAFATGAHGMPQIIDPENGKIDPAGLAAFLNANPAWRPMLSYGRTNQGCIAIINDLGAAGGGRVEIPPEPPAPEVPPAPLPGLEPPPAPEPAPAPAPDAGGYDAGGYVHPESSEGKGGGHYLPWNSGGAEAGDEYYADPGWTGDDWQPGDELTPEAEAGDEYYAADELAAGDEAADELPEGLIGVSFELVAPYLGRGGR